MNYFATFLNCAKITKISSELQQQKQLIRWYFSDYAYQFGQTRTKLIEPFRNLVSVLAKQWEREPVPIRFPKCCMFKTDGSGALYV